jgi:hypothetical protein
MQNHENHVYKNSVVIWVAQQSITLNLIYSDQSWKLIVFNCLEQGRTPCTDRMVAVWRISYAFPILAKQTKQDIETQILQLTPNICITLYEETKFPYRVIHNKPV